MIILDWIRNILGNNKKNTTIYTKSIVKKFGEKDQFEVALFDADNPLPGKDIVININGMDYTRVTDDSGVARLNINLQPEVYPVLITFNGDDVYNSNTAHAQVIVQSDTRMEGTDVNKVFGDSTAYQCAVYSNNGRVAGSVKLTINGKSYIRTPDANRLYKLNINLQPGTYILNAEFLGNKVYLPSSVQNKITVKEVPVAPQKSRSEKILDEFEKYFGKCEYIDDALAKIRNHKYAFYFSDGYNMYDTIKRMANYQGANCYDAAEVFYHLMLGMNTKYGRNYEPQYLHVWCPSSKVDHIRLRFKSNGSGWYYRDPASVLDGGSVESNWCGTSGNILEVNPSFILDG